MHVLVEILTQINNPFAVVSALQSVCFKTQRRQFFSFSSDICTWVVCHVNHQCLQSLCYHGPFAANSKMIQNPPCWRASYALGHPKQRKFKFDWMKSLCFGCPSLKLALQHFGFCTMWPLAAKDPLNHQNQPLCLEHCKKLTGCWQTCTIVSVTFSCFDTRPRTRTATIGRVGLWRTDA